MITINSLEWGNWFSYGEPNNLDFTTEKVTQITGINGSGKSSIPVILGEVLYSKNALGKTKQKLANRYLDKPDVNAVVDFSKDGIDYRVVFSRKSTLKLKLLMDGTDISSHTTTNTYKTLEVILGFDFKTFWQLIYQSSKEGLDFLTATDTNRKKFLVNLFNLNSYLDIHEDFKKHATKINNELMELTGEINTIESWIAKHETEDLTELPLQAMPEIEDNKIDELSDLKSQLLTLNEDNKKINQNNQFINLLNNLDTSTLNEMIDMPNESKQDLEAEKHELWNKITTGVAQVRSNTEFINKIENLGDKCPTCEQEIDKNFVEELLDSSKEIVQDAEEDSRVFRDKITEIDTILLKIKRAENKKANQSVVADELQDLLSKIDKSLPTEVYIEQDLKDQINILNADIKSINDYIKDVTAHNAKAERHNSRIKVIKEQLVEYREKLVVVKAKYENNSNILNRLTVIKKAFSTNGLINYKIDYLIKDLEFQINSYLEELSSGKFQLNFILKGEKLNIEILDDDKSITIEELSAGELARVNTATLLAIRKLMAAISSTKLNILFLDEITGVLDDEGKEKLIEILMEEEELNTFLVSHEYDHPLIPKINIVKENKVSRIEE